YDEGKGPPEITLQFQINPPRDPPPFEQKIETTLLINGERPKDHPGDGKGKDNGPVTLANPFTVQFKPQVRDSTVQLRLSAPSCDPMIPDSVLVQYLRLPYGIEFTKPPAESEKPEIELTARVQSALPLRPQDIRATVKDRPIQNV